jgi:hypothetical protein
MGIWRECALGSYFRAQQGAATDLPSKFGWSPGGATTSRDSLIPRTLSVPLPAAVLHTRNTSSPDRREPVASSRSQACQLQLLRTEGFDVRNEEGGTIRRIYTFRKVFVHLYIQDLL